MGLKKRLQKKLEKAVDSVKDTVGGAYDDVKDFKSGVQDHLKAAGGSVQDYAKDAGNKAKEGYKRYKDPILAGTAITLGAILAPVTGGASALAGAAIAASLYGAGKFAYDSNRARQEARSAEKDFNAQMGGLEGGSMADMIRRRRLRRGAGEGVAEFTSDSQGLADAQEVAA